MPREEIRIVASCDFGSEEICAFTAEVGTEYADDVTEFMDMDEDLAQEYIKELGDIFASELYWSEAEWFYPGVEVRKEMTSSDGRKHDVIQTVGVCGENIVYTNSFQLL